MGQSNVLTLLQQGWISFHPQYNKLLENGVQPMNLSYYATVMFLCSLWIKLATSAGLCGNGVINGS